MVFSYENMTLIKMFPKSVVETIRVASPANAQNAACIHQEMPGNASYV